MSSLMRQFTENPQMMQSLMGGEAMQNAMHAMAQNPQLMQQVIISW
jgi:hypothetical protein